MCAVSRTVRPCGTMLPWSSSGLRDKLSDKLRDKLTAKLSAGPFSLPEPRVVLFQNAEVHHHEDSCIPRFFSSLLVNHVFLHPDRWNLQLNRLVHNLFYELRPPKNIHNVDLLRHLEQRSVGLLAQTRFDLRIHRNDAVALILHESAD